MAVAMPALSISSSDLCGVQSLTGGESKLDFLSELTHSGGERWWCTSMRCGLADVCAVAESSMPKVPNVPKVPSEPKEPIVLRKPRRVEVPLGSAGQHLHRLV